LGHVLNIFISMGISEHLGENSDECAWYFLLYIIDVTVGTLMNMLLLSLLLSVARKKQTDHRY